MGLLICYFRVGHVTSRLFACYAHLSAHQRNMPVMRYLRFMRIYALNMPVRHIKRIVALRASCCALGICTLISAHQRKAGICTLISAHQRKAGMHGVRRFRRPTQKIQRRHNPV